ncbi:MAG: HEAT repeat domain-containing protein [Planctomycetes bacterium]|nr:HEAT repeat domain-containing protein [Planctomycetota bacterium]
MLPLVLAAVIAVGCAGAGESRNLDELTSNRDEVVEEGGWTDATYGFGWLLAAPFVGLKAAFYDFPVWAWESAFAPGPVDAMVDQLDDEAPERRYEAYARLAAMRLDSAIDLADLRRAVPPIERRLLLETEPDLKARGLEALRRIGDPAALGTVTRHLLDPNDGVRASAVLAAGVLGDAATRERLLEEWRGLAPGDFQRLPYITALGNLRAREIEGDLLALLANDRADVMERVWSAWALGRMGCAAAREALLVALLSDDGRLAMAGAVGVALLGDFDALADVARSGGPETAHAALSQIGEFGSDRDIPTLRGFLAAGDPQVRFWAAYGLARLDFPDAVPLLIDVLEQYRGPVERLTALGELQRMTGHGEGDLDPGKWRAWWEEHQAEWPEIRRVRDRTREFPYG